MTSRREFLAQSTAAALASVAPWPFAQMDDPWTRAAEIERRIRPPVFGARVDDITTYGARGDGVTDCSDALRRAIAACAAAGGGRVLVPAGRYLTGPIHLATGVELHLTADATLAFYTDPQRYLPAVLTRWEGVELMGYSPLIYAYGARNIGVTGRGVLDGQASARAWWPWKGSREYGFVAGQLDQKVARAALFEAAERGTPVAERRFADGSGLRPQFIQPYQCENVLIEGVTIRNSPMWEIHPVLCRNVIVRGVTVDSHGPNNDGCDPESCVDVLIEDCTFDTGDDCIAIKSGRNADGRRLGKPTENVIIRRCQMRDGHGGVTLGSEISGDVRWVFVEQCTMDSPALDRAIRLKTNAMRGGVLEHLYVRDVTVGRVAEAILHIDFTYEEGAKGGFLPKVRDIELQRVTSRSSQQALMLRGFANAPIQDVRLVDCRFDGVQGADVLEHVSGLKRRGVTVNGKAVS